MTDGLQLYVSWDRADDDGEWMRRFHVGVGRVGPTCGSEAEWTQYDDEAAEAFWALLGHLVDDDGEWCPHCSRWLAGYMGEGDPPLVT